MEGSGRDGPRDVAVPSSKPLKGLEGPPFNLHAPRPAPAVPHASYCAEETRNLPHPPPQAAVSPHGLALLPSEASPSSGAPALSHKPTPVPTLSQAARCGRAQLRARLGYSEERTGIWLRAGQRLPVGDKEGTQLPVAGVGNGCKACGFGDLPFQTFSTEQSRAQPWCSRGHPGPPMSHCPQKWGCLSLGRTVGVAG